MKDVAVVARRHGEDVDLGHPVRSFILVMVAVGVLLLVLQWSGAVMPRVSSTSGGMSENDLGQILQAEVHNDGPLAVDVVGARWPVEDAVVIGLGVLPMTDDGTGYPLSLGVAPFAPFTLEPGESGWIGLAIRAQCGGEAQVGALELDVRAPVDIERTMTFEYQQQSVTGTC